MPFYTYKAKTPQGETKTGNKEAADQRELARALHQEQLLLVSAEAAGVKKPALGEFTLLSLIRRITLVEKMMFTKNLAVMVDAGLGLSQALRSLSEQTKSPKFSKVIIQIERNVREGKAFSDSLAEHDKIFNELYINMVRVGETSGNLSEVLRLMADQMKKDHELVSRVRGAMIYPGVIVTSMAGIGTLMMIVVVPQLKEVFSDLEIELPFLTRMIISFSEFLTNNLLLGVLALVVVIVLIRMAARTNSGKKFFHKIFLILPIIGSVSQKVNSARFARTFSSLIDSGVSMVRTLEITAGTLGNIFFSESLQISAKEVQKGKPLSQCLASYSSLYPPMVIQMLEVGEETGGISDVLKNLADFYEGEVNNITKNMSAIIEPVLMIIVGGAVGLFAVSMIQPMYSMMSSI